MTSWISLHSLSRLSGVSCILAENTSFTSFGSWGKPVIVHPPPAPLPLTFPLMNVCLAWSSWPQPLDWCHVIMFNDVLPNKGWPTLPETGGYAKCHSNYASFTYASKHLHIFAIFSLHFYICSCCYFISTAVAVHCVCQGLVKTKILIWLWTETEIHSLKTFGKKKVKHFKF